MALVLFGTIEDQLWLDNVFLAPRITYAAEMQRMHPSP